MTREEAKELLPIIKAFAEGRNIEYKNEFGSWTATDCPLWTNRSKYRIKPEPRYRPFKTQEECWNEMLKHQPFGWLKEKANRKEMIHIGRIYDVTNNTLITLSIDEGLNLDSSYLFRTYTFADDTPFGIKEE